MTSLYGKQHREFQIDFGTDQLADTVEKIIVHSEFTEQDKAFIQSRDFFFLSTVDHQGRPSVSYKGGEKGVVKIVNENTLAFPCYDGNGMFLSVGNINMNGKVGMLFIDFENPHRLRAYGDATVDKDDPLLESYHEAQLIVRVNITELWVNCPRYIHKYKRVDTSEYVPKTDCETPLPDWKKLDKLQPMLPNNQSSIVEKQGGTITLDELHVLEERND